MQITVHKNHLLACLKRASAAVSPGDAVYKACVLVAAGTSEIRVSATDDVTSVYTTLPGGAKEPGRALLPHRRLTAIANELPDGESEISVNLKLQVSIRSLGSKRKFTMSAVDADLFPKIAETGPGDKLCEVEVKALQQSSSDVGLAIDEGYIHGALLVPSEQRFQLVSVDGRSLVVSSGDLVARESTEPVVIPQRLMTAGKLLPATGTCSVHVTESKVSLVTVDTTISCNRLMLPFSNVWIMILEGAPTDKRFRVSADALLSSVRAVCVATDVIEGEGKRASIQVDIAYKNGECTITTRESDSSHGEDVLAVNEPSEGEFLLRLNGLLLGQALRCFGPEHVDVFYGEVSGGTDILLLKSDTLTIGITPIRFVK